MVEAFKKWFYTKVLLDKKNEDIVNLRTQPLRKTPERHILAETNVIFPERKFIESRYSKIEQCV